MTYQTISIERNANNIITCHLGRADKYHALNEEMIHELTTAFSDFTPDNCRAVILSSDGPHFCAGGDLKWMKEQQTHSRTEKKQQAQYLAEMLDKINQCPCPVIARIQGNAFGGGVGLISVCDMAVSSNSAGFALTEVKLGIIPATISPFVIAKIGQNGARQLMLTAQMISAEKAMQLGLVSEICAENKLDERIEALTSAILKAGPEAVAATKTLIHALDKTPPQDRQALSINALADTWEREEAKQGIEAFFAKTPPPWMT